MTDLLNRLDSIHKQLLATVATLDEESFARRPSAEQWSVAEIVHHLNLVEQRVIHELEQALQQPPRQVSFVRRFIPTSIVSSRAIRVKAPRAVTPNTPPDKRTAIDDFNSSRAKLKELYRTHGRKRFRQLVFKHPFLGEISGVATISFVGHHERRHYKQIREAIKQLS